MSASAFQNILVTGANRGIGLEFVQQFLDSSTPPKNIIATTRSESETLNALKSKHSNLHVLKLESIDYESHDGFVKQVESIVGSDGLDLLINNAGIYAIDSLETLNAKHLMRLIENNGVAPIVLTQKLLPLLKVAAKQRKTVIAQITSDMGSIAQAEGCQYAYRASKVTLNMLSKSLSVDVKPDNVIVLLLHPGWVATDMGTDAAPITPQQSIAGMMKILADCSIERTCQYVDWTGKPWKW